MGTAQTGRTHDLHPTASRKPKESLDPWAPSTHDPSRHLATADCRIAESGQYRLLAGQEHARTVALPDALSRQLIRMLTFCSRRSEFAKKRETE
jgi:hypothetical protein